MPGTSRIKPRRRRRIYLAEWRKFRDMSQEALGKRLRVAGMTVSRWERSTSKALLNTDVMAAIAEALGIEPEDLFRHPDQPSADAMLRDQPTEIRDEAIKIIKAIRKAS